MAKTELRFVKFSVLLLYPLSWLCDQNLMKSWIDNKNISQPKTNLKEKVKARTNLFKASFWHIDGGLITENESSKYNITIHDAKRK